LSRSRKEFSSYTFFALFLFILSLSFFSFLPFLSYSRHPFSHSPWLPHSRLPLRPVQLLPTIRCTITFRSTTLPTSSSLYSRAFCFPPENLHRLSTRKSFRVRKFCCKLGASSVRHYAYPSFHTLLPKSNGLMLV